MTPETEAYVKSRAQYIADRIDATIFLKHRDWPTLREPADAAVDAFLLNEGWAGRKYPADFFRIDTVPESVLREVVG